MVAWEAMECWSDRMLNEDVMKRTDVDDEDEIGASAMMTTGVFPPFSFGFNTMKSHDEPWVNPTGLTLLFIVNSYTFTYKSLGPSLLLNTPSQQEYL